METRTIYIENQHEPFITVSDELKLIVKLECLCDDFKIRRLKKVGKVQDIKYYSEPCKHLKPWVDTLIKQGYKMRIPKVSQGLDKLTPKLRKLILEMWGKTCYFNGCNNLNIEIHRIHQGVHNGKYSVDNCRPLCNEHHKLITYQPWHR